MSASNLHVYVMAVPLLTAFFVNLLGRVSKSWIAPLTLGSLTFSSIASLFVLGKVIVHGRFRVHKGKELGAGLGSNFLSRLSLAA